MESFFRPKTGEHKVRPYGASVLAQPPHSVIVSGFEKVFARVLRFPETLSLSARGGATTGLSRNLVQLGIG